MDNAIPEFSLEAMTPEANPYIDGKKWAQSLKVGDLFIGCLPEAHNRYGTDTTLDCRVAVNMFTDGAMEILGSIKIHTTGSGRIT